MADHRCHARKCTKGCPPAHLMCARHWRMVPYALQKAVWKYYRPGQEKDKTPSVEYIEAAKAAIEAVGDAA